MGIFFFPKYVTRFCHDFQSHFTPDAFTKRGNRRFLKPSAEPTIFKKDEVEARSKEILVERGLWPVRTQKWESKIRSRKIKKEDFDEEPRVKKLKCEICDLNQFDNAQELSKHMHIEHKRKLLLPKSDQIQSESQKTAKNICQSPISISSPGIAGIATSIQIQKIPMAQGFRSEPIITSRPILIQPMQPIQSQILQGQNSMLSNLGQSLMPRSLKVPMSLPPKKVPIPRKQPVYKEGSLEVYVKEAPTIKEEPKDDSEDPLDPLSKCEVFIKEETE